MRICHFTCAIAMYIWSLNVEYFNSIACDDLVAVLRGPQRVTIDPSARIYNSLFAIKYITVPYLLYVCVSIIWGSLPTSMTMKNMQKFYGRN